MYQYDEFDHQIVRERVAQFRDQVGRRLRDELTEDEFRPLRLQNGLYYQRHAYMLRVAIPYGLLSSAQLRMLAHIAHKYDRDYGHFSTRQNIQYNWIKLEDVPDILADLASVEMHAIQTSGNCIRNITSDQFAGVAADEIVDPRPVCEILRQWSTFHPEFAHLPRKFKIAVCASRQDRAATQLHDIGVYLYRSPQDELVARVMVGGGMGRTPYLGSVIKENLPIQDLLSYCEAVLRTYNRYGRRDNKYKARIKILLKALGAKEFASQVEAEWAHLRGGPATLTGAELARVSAYFVPPSYRAFPGEDESFAQHRSNDKAFARWVERNVQAHRVAGYASVTLSLKPHGRHVVGDAPVPPGDATTEQMNAVADLVDRFSFGQLRVAHEQNLILADVQQSDLFVLWKEAGRLGFATPNIGLLTDIICCPGGDFCSLANAKSIPIASAIQARFDDLDYVYDLGELSINISGCINACGHHHIGNIGVLGVDKDGEEWYQVTLGGAQGNASAIGKVIGPSFKAEEMPEVVARVIETFVDHRHEDELFIDAVNRLGVAPFKERVYADRAPKQRAAATA